MHITVMMLKSNVYVFCCIVFHFIEREWELLQSDKRVVAINRRNGRETRRRWTTAEIIQNMQVIRAWLITFNNQISWISRWILIYYCFLAGMISAQVLWKIGFKRRWRIRPWQIIQHHPVSWIPCQLILWERYINYFIFGRSSSKVN